MSLPSIELIRGALLAFELSTEGSHEVLHARLGAHLVARMLGSSTSTPRPSSTSGKATGKRPMPSGGDAKEKKRRIPSKWVQFLSSERKKVVQAMPGATNAMVVQEVARRWKLFKQVNTSTAPLMLRDNESSCEAADLAATLAGECGSEEIKEKLKEAHIEASDDHSTNAQLLAIHWID